MSKKEKLLLIATAMSVCLIVSAVLREPGVSSSPGPNEPLNLQDIVNFPSPCSASLTHILCNLLLMNYYAVHVEGLSWLSPEMTNEGFTTFDYFGTDEGSVNFTGTVDGTTFFRGNATGGWSNANAKGERALEAWAAMNDGTSIMIAAVTNLLPPSHTTGSFNIQNAMPYVYIDFCFAYGWKPDGRIVRWYYWQYSSSYQPNWFWGMYLWWRTNLKEYNLSYESWYWWFWHWYYWQFWYWWGTNFPYS